MSTTDSPYRRDNYFGKTESDERGRATQNGYGTGDGPTTNPGPAGTWNPPRNDPAEHVAHQVLKDCGDLLCRATAEDPPWNGGRLGQLFAWLFADDEDDLIEVSEWALHHENRAVPLSSPELYPPAETVGEFRHARRFNPETGYLNWSTGDTGVLIPDRDVATFMVAVRLWLHRRGGSPKRDRILRYARTLKRQGYLSDQEVLRRVIQRTRNQDIPECD